MLYDLTEWTEFTRSETIVQVFEITDNMTLSFGYSLTQLARKLPRSVKLTK